MEKRGLIAQDRNGAWLPAVPLDRITWEDVSKAYDLGEENFPVRLSEWLESALQARGVVGYRQDTENLPSLEAILKRQTEVKKISPPAEPHPMPEPLRGSEPGPIQVVEATEVQENGSDADKPV